jgi:glycosyltransferase involved in cell wall biosynthesis
MTASRSPVVGHVVLSLDVGGLERVVATLALRQHASGRRIVVYCLDRPGALAEPLVAAGIAVRVVQRSARGFDPRALARLARAMRTDGIGVAHCHNYAALVYGSLAARMGGAVVVYTVHGAHTSARRATGRFQSLHLVDRVVFVSADARSVAARNGAVSARGVSTILNGVDVDALARSPEGGRAIRREFGIESDAPVIGVVARLTRAKDHLTLFDAVAALRSEWPRMRCLVVGDGELRDELRRAVSERGLDGVVVFTGARSDIREVLSAMDVFALSSVTEGLAVTLLEAMSAGLPVVATRVGGNPEVVEDGVTGVLVDPKEPEALARAIASLLADPDRARTMGQAGIARVRAHFSLESMIRAYDEVYGATAGRPRAGK